MCMCDFWDGGGKKIVGVEAAKGQGWRSRAAIQRESEGSWGRPLARPGNYSGNHEK
jgi:hypothetical protein